MYDGHMFGFGGIFMWLFWILLIAVIIWAAKAVLGANGGPKDKTKSALDILQERYARGEIDKVEYEQKRKDLSG